MPGSSARRVPVVVVGGGAIGCAILYELAGRGIAGLLVEAEPDLGEGASKANSAIVHTGFDAKPGTVEARMLRRAAELWPDLVEALGVPFLPVGALMLARTATDAARLRDEVAANAAALGVRTELLGRDEVRAAAPYLADDVAAALSVPEESVVDPFWLVRAYAEAAIAAGAEVRLGAAVAGLRLDADGALVRLSDGTEIAADQVIDAAGLQADEVAALAGDTGFAISPRKGQFLVSEETFGVDRIVLPIPGPMGKGMLVTPIVFGGLLLGPTATDGSDKTDRSTDASERERILASCRSMVPALAGAVPVRAFAGLRTVSSTGDFILRPSAAGDRLYLAAGIRSTGVSTSPAVAEAVADAVIALRGWGARLPAARRLAPPPTELPEAAGEIACLCRSIGRGEVEAACRHATAPHTLDAIKRRGGPTFGDCQGNLCALDVARIVAAERGLPVTAVERHRAGSWLWLGREGQARPAGAGGATGAPDRGPLPARADVVVVGGGAAGRAAAAAAEAAGRTAVVIERRPGGDGGGRVAVATAVGLSQAGSGWAVIAQSADGTAEIGAGAVVVATGAYVEPREHRAIDGPRPAGIMTGDLCRRLLEEGLLPGRRAVLVGESARTAALAGDLAAAGVAVERLAAPPDAVRGLARLEGVRAGGAWRDADTLVLDDRLLPQAFLLRGLGLLDNRPGTPLPADGEGRLPLPGLWAAGCCVRPDADHADCAADGRRVGGLAAAALAGSAPR